VSGRGSVDMPRGANVASAWRVIRTRWLVAIALAVVAGIGALVFVDETDRSEAGLDDLGE